MSFISSAANSENGSENNNYLKKVVITEACMHYLIACINLIY